MRVDELHRSTMIELVEVEERHEQVSEQEKKITRNYRGALMSMDHMWEDLKKK